MKRENLQSATMEDLCKRFPHLGALIFANLDDQTFTKCKEANKEISQFFNRERFCWIRIIRHYHDNFETFQESWKEAIDKTSVENVKQLAVAVQKFFKLHPVSSHKKVAPLHIAAEQENLPLCEHIISKLNDKNPQGNLFIINEHTLESKFRFEIWREKKLLWCKGPYQDNSTPHCSFEKQFGTIQTHSK